MAMLTEGGDHFFPGRGFGQGNDLAARDRHVVGVMLAEMQQVAQHLPLHPRQVAARLAATIRGRGTVFVLMLVNGFFKLFAQGTRAFKPEDLAKRRPKPAATVRFSRRGGRRMGIGHGLACGS